jgi:CRP/FNR family transcriptional regulator, cyclic AMP receptor protein
MDPFAALKENPLLRGFTDDGVRIIQAAITQRRLEPGSPIFVERMLGESAFLLAQGEISLFVTRQGQEREIGALLAPESFGELALLAPGPRRISARARTGCLLLEIPRRDFLTLQKQRPQACLKLLSNIIERFGQKAGEAAPALERVVDGSL